MKNLLCGDERELNATRIQRVCDHFAHGAAALPAIEFTSVMRLHSLRRSRASFDSVADTFLVYTAADANDHANDLQPVRMIVKNDSHLDVSYHGARNGWRLTQEMGIVPT